MGPSEKAARSREEILGQIALGIAPASGSEFFPLLVHHLAQSLGVSCAIVGELQGAYDASLKAVTANLKGRLNRNLRYPIEGSPLENVITGQPFAYGSGVRETFPEDSFLQEMAFESFSAIPLHDSEGAIVGVLAVMSDHADPDTNLTLEVLHFLAPRIGGEIERRRTEEALQLTQFSLDRSGDASFWIAPDGRFLQVNDAACDALGYKRDELCAMTVADIDPRCPPDVWRKIWKKLRWVKSLTIESLHQRKDGSTFPIEITASHVEFGGQEYSWSFSRDITERKRAEALVAGQSQVLELIAKGAPLEKTLSALTDVIEEQSPEALSLICLLDEARGTLSPKAGPSVAETFKEAIIGTFVREGEGACGTAAHRRSLVVVEDVTTDPLFANHLDLMERHNLLACWSSPILSSAGKCLGTFAMFYRTRRRPGTRELALIETASHLARVAIERKQDEESLRLSSERFRHLIERMPEGILVHRFGPIVYANAKAAQALGYDRPEDLVGRSVSDLLEPSQRKWAEKRLQKMYETRKAAPARETRIVRKDGRITIAELETIPIEFDGEPAVITIARDVTERKRKQALLLQADRMAAVGTLAAGVAHEINNPLAYVISNLDYLAREIPTMLKALTDGGGPSPQGANGRGAEGLADGLDDIQATIQDAREGAERVCQIVRDLRTFSRDGEDDLCPVDIHRVLESSINIARKEIEKGARLVRELRPVPPVQATESRLGQVFLNLLMNAAQAMPENRSGKNEIRVRTRRAGKGQVLVEIEDTGVGIPPRNIDQIFQPFFTTKPVGIGTGLGLSICHNIVTTLSGEITVKSRPGRYTRFSVLLPVSSSHAD